MNMTNFAGIDLKDMQVTIEGVTIKPYIVDGILAQNDPFSAPVLQLTIQLPMGKYEQEKLREAGKKVLNEMYGVKKHTGGISIKNVIFNPPATIVFWNDNTKTVVKTQNGEEFDQEKGLAMAILKRIAGNKGCYYNDFAKWCKNYKAEEEKSDKIQHEEMNDIGLADMFSNFTKSLVNAMNEVNKPAKGKKYGAEE